MPFFVPEITAEAQQAAMRVLTSGWLTTGPEVRSFETEFAEWVGVDHAVAVSSCTAALEIALMAMRLRPGAKVLTSTLTFCGAVHAIVHAGFVPVLADVNPRTLMPDTATVAAATRRCGGADAMMALHFAGHHAWHLYVIRLQASFGVPRDVVIERLSAVGVSCSVHFIPIHRLQYFDQLLQPDRAWFPGAESAYQAILSLPLYPGMADEDVDYVCAKVAALRHGVPRRASRKTATAGSRHA
ncbi:MAG: hypothetical protein NVSMB32_10360 [Actinomycetota bacterium]